MDNQHKLIKGYRDLPQADIDLMNKIKSHAVATKELLDEVDAHVAKQFSDINLIANDTEAAGELERMAIAQPEKWVSQAETDLQVGFMKLVRAVAQPTSF